MESKEKQFSPNLDYRVEKLNLDVNYKKNQMHNILRIERDQMKFT